MLSHRPGRFWCVCPLFYVGDSVAPVLSRRRILWVEAFAQGCSDGICANTQGHITRCARARGLAQFSGTYMRDIRCLRSAVLQPPGRTPAVVARGTRAFCLVRAMPFAPWLVLRVAARRRSLSYALSRGAGFCLTRRCPVAEMDCARGGPRGFCSAMFG